MTMISMWDASCIFRKRGLLIDIEVLTGKIKAKNQNLLLIGRGLQPFPNNPFPKYDDGKR